MNSARLFIVAFLSLSFILSGCKGAAKKTQGGPAVLAAVNGVPITEADLALKLGNHEEFLSDKSLRDKVLDSIIAEELMYQKGMMLGFDKDQKFQSEIRKMELKITAYKRAEMGRRVRDTQVASHVTVTDGEVKDYYAKHADEIGTDLHLGVLQFGDAEKAKEALAGVRAGTPFEKIAAEHFAHAPKGMGRAWDKGVMHWNQVPPAFVDAVYRLKKGEVSDVLTSGPSEAYLVKVIDRKKNPAASFERVKTDIENRLWAARGKEAYENYIQQLKKEATIKKY